MKKDELIRSTIDGTTVQECSTLKSLNTKVWKVLRNAGMTDSATPETYRLVGNYAGGLGVTQVDGYWKANATRNPAGSRAGAGKPKAILSNEEVLAKQYALKGMEAANDPTLTPLIDALKAELAAHKAAKSQALASEADTWWQGLTTEAKIALARAHKDTSTALAAALASTRARVLEAPDNAPDKAPDKAPDNAPDKAPDKAPDNA